MNIAKQSYQPFNAGPYNYLKKYYSGILSESALYFARRSGAPIIWGDPFIRTDHYAISLTLYFLPG